jgi:hypothetical protein
VLGHNLIVTKADGSTAKGNDELIDLNLEQNGNSDQIQTMEVGITGDIDSTLTPIQANPFLDYDINGFTTSTETSMVAQSSVECLHPSYENFRTRHVDFEVIGAQASGMLEDWLANPSLV